MKTLAVHPWPGPAPQPEGGLFVISVQTAPRRAAARQQIRQALTEALAAVLRLPVTSIGIASAPGAAPAVVLQSDDHHTVHCSFAHEDGLSLAAVNLNGPVGVDLMRVQAIDDWQVVARDYLGPAAAAISASPPEWRMHVFACAWTAREARLKCLGLPLSEWQEDSKKGVVYRRLSVSSVLSATLAADVLNPKVPILRQEKIDDFN